MLFLKSQNDFELYVMQRLSLFYLPARVWRRQHATAEGHSEDSHPDAWGPTSAHTTGPGNTHTHTHSWTLRQYSIVGTSPRRQAFSGSDSSLAE